MGNFSCPTSSYARVFVWEEGSIFFSNPLLCGFDDHLRVVFHFLTLGWDGEPRGWCTSIRGLKQRLWRVDTNNEEPNREEDEETLIIFDDHDDVIEGVWKLQTKPHMEANHLETYK